MDQNNYQSLSHSKWDCKYHVVFVPKYRRKALYGEIRRQLGPILHELAKQKECQIIEGHLMPDHVHMCILIPPKRSLKKSGRSNQRTSCAPASTRRSGRSRTGRGT
jgi:putative transposase